MGCQELFRPQPRGPKATLLVRWFWPSMICRTSWPESLWCEGCQVGLCDLPSSLAGWDSNFSLLIFLFCQCVITSLLSCTPKGQLSCFRFLKAIRIGFGLWWFTIIWSEGPAWLAVQEGAAVRCCHLKTSTVWLFSIFINCWASWCQEKSKVKKSKVLLE